MAVAPGASFTPPTDPSTIEAQRNQVKEVIVQTSWQMVFASSEAEFNSLWESMQKTAKGLGYDDVLEFDMEGAHAQNEAREKIVAEFG